MFAIVSPTESICLGRTINHGGVIWRVKATNENTAWRPAESFNFSLKSRKICEMFISFFPSCLSSFRQEEAFCYVASSHQKSHRHAMTRDGISGPSRILSIVWRDFKLMPWLEIELKTVQRLNMCAVIQRTFSECFPQKLDIRNFFLERKGFDRALPKHSMRCEYFISLETLFTRRAICFSFHTFPPRLKNVKLKVAAAYVEELYYSQKWFKYLHCTAAFSRNHCWKEKSPWTLFSQQIAFPQFCSEKTNSSEKGNFRSTPLRLQICQTKQPINYRPFYFWGI